MKKFYEAPEAVKIEFDVEEALMASVIKDSGADITEIGKNPVILW